MQVINIHYPKYNNHDVSYKNISTHRNRTHNKTVSNTDKAKAIIGSLIGTAIPMVIMIKNQKIKILLNLNTECGIW